MIYTREQKQSAYKRLPPEIQDLTMDNEVMDLIANTLVEAGLNEEQAALADSEILYAMYCLQSLDDAIEAWKYLLEQKELNWDQFRDLFPNRRYLLDRTKLRAWLNYEDAMKKMKIKNNKEMLKEAYEFIKEYEKQKKLD